MSAEFDTLLRRQGVPASLIGNAPIRDIPNSLEQLFNVVERIENLMPRLDQVISFTDEKVQLSDGGSPISHRQAQLACQLDGITARLGHVIAVLESVEL